MVADAVPRSLIDGVIAPKILLSLAACLVAFAAGDTPFNYGVVEAKIASRDFATARKELEACLQINPNDARGHLLMGIVLAETNDPSGAEQHFREAAKLNPADSASHVNLGKLLAARGEPAAAAGEFEEALDRDPKSVAALMNLGLIQNREKEFSHAETHLQRAAALAPGDNSILVALLQAQLGAKQLRAAESTADRILASTTPQPGVLQAIGAMQAEAGDYVQAIRHLEKARTLAPDSYDIEYNLGLAYQRSGDSKQALEILEPISKRNSSAELANLLGTVYEQNSRYLDAIRAFQRAAEAEPQNEDYRFDYIWELLDHRSFEPARLVAEPAVRDFPSSMRMKLALGVSWFGLQQYRRAQDLFVETSKQFPSDDLPLYYVTFAPDTSEIPVPETKALLTHQHERYPERFLPLYMLGHVELREGDTTIAADLLQKSVRLQPNHTQAHYELGRAYAELRRFHEAIPQYQMALRLDPHFTAAWYRLYLAANKSGDAALARQAEAKFRKLQEESEHQDTIQSFVYQMRE
jgi:tetratricopeptide (TPR) repeat protein